MVVMVEAGSLKIVGLVGSSKDTPRILKEEENPFHSHLSSPCEALQATPNCQYGLPTLCSTSNRWFSALLAPPCKSESISVRQGSFLAYQPSYSELTTNETFQAGTTAIGNSVQAYLTLHFTDQVYLLNASPSPLFSSNNNATKSPKKATGSAPQVTPLQSRTFGTWTFTSALVRLYAAYNIHNPAFYQLAFLTFVIAWLHFMSEWWAFGTAAWGRGLAGPVVVSTASMIWMVLVQESYVG